MSREEKSKLGAECEMMEPATRDVFCSKTFLVTYRPDNSSSYTLAAASPKALPHNKVVSSLV